MKKTIKIGIINGIVFKNMTIYKAELIHLKNDNLTYKEIAKILNITETKVQHYYKDESQPKDEIIEKLEKMFFKREKDTLEDLRNPYMIK